LQAAERGEFNWETCALYCRVSTADQSCARQERDLTAFADRAGYEVIGVFKETGSGVKLDRVERRKVMALAQARRIDAVLVTKLSRWGAVRRTCWRHSKSWRHDECRSWR
jgi:DNA invertase Pin-like site-specific DNA recombinase